MIYSHWEYQTVLAKVFTFYYIRRRCCIWHVNATGKTLKWERLSVVLILSSGVFGGRWSSRDMMAAGLEKGGSCC